MMWTDGNASHAALAAEVNSLPPIGISGDMDLVQTIGENTLASHDGKKLVFIYTVTTVVRIIGRGKTAKSVDWNLNDWDLHLPTTDKCHIYAIFSPEHFGHLWFILSANMVLM